MTMKKTILIAILLSLSLCLTENAQAQFNPFSTSTKLINAGVGISSWGIPVYASFELPVIDNVTVGAGLSYQSDTERFGSFKWKHEIFGIGVLGNYHFNELLDIPDQFDLYGGVSLGYFNWSTKSTEASINYGGSGNGGLSVGIQAGGRYFFTENLAANLELGGGSVLSGGRLGITFTF